MRRVLAAVLVLPAALVTACASSQRGEPSSPAPSSAGGAAQAEAAARAEADRLVGAAELPTGATRVSSPPSGLEGAAMGTPASSQLIDTVAYFSVSSTMADTRAWFEAHPQGGAAVTGTSSVTGRNGLDVYGFTYTPTAQHPWGSAYLDVSIAAEGTTAAIRVDGMALWIDPSPRRDTVTGPTTRLTVDAGCPSSDDGLRDVTNPGADDLDDRLLPAATPTRALTCDYTGMNDGPFTLSSKQVLDAGQAADLADHIRAIPLGSKGDGPRSCPMDDGRARLTAFSYPGRDDVDIWQSTSGCTSTDNGHIVADGA